MKKIFALALALLMVLSLAACGGDASAPVEEAQNSAAETPADMNDPAADSDEGLAEMPALEAGEESVSVEMLYYKKLDDSSIMAAACTEEGIAMLGNDYYIVLVGDAAISNAQGEAVTLDDLTRGCPIEVKWPGMVMESYPGQIAALEVIALSDEADPSVPAEDEIQPIGDGPVWWEEEAVTEIPDLVIEYTTPLYLTSMWVEARAGGWGYMEEGTFSGGGSNSTKDGIDVHDRVYDDSNTIKETGIETLTLILEPMADEITVTAYDAANRDDAGTAVELDENNTFALLPGENLYEITCTWDGEGKHYQGAALYSIKVAAQ